MNKRTIKVSSIGGREWGGMRKLTLPQIMMIPCLLFFCHNKANLPSVVLAITAL